MKFFKFLSALLVTATLFSCSSDGDSSDSTANYFNLTYNGTAKTVNIASVQAVKSEDYIEVLGVTSEGAYVSFDFNTHGNLYEASYDGDNHEATFAHYSNSSFTFELVDLNTTNKTVRVNFSGKVYENEYDHTSAFSTMSGSFKISYMDYNPPVTGMGTYAKLNGADWYGMTKSGSGDGTIMELSVQNGGEYTIGIVYPYSGAETGTFAFDNSDVNRISFSKYDTTTHEMIEYNVAGTMTYTTASSIVQGTFSLTATHPTNGSTVTITNGTFKEGAL
ncbi:hypothetical protein [Flavobacterium sp.]|uniref:hypothetical protein n=1 Tax=Flavobacterium sp. TaxID=239 RepID=UPI00262D6ABC|nr:hypothetical protein [Flavobacterium sp.]